MNSIIRQYFGLGSTYWIITFFMGIVGVVFGVLKSLGILKIAKRKNEKYSWLAQVYLWSIIPINIVFSIIYSTLPKSSTIAHVISNIITSVLVILIDYLLCKIAYGKGKILISYLACKVAQVFITSISSIMLMSYAYSGKAMINMTFISRLGQILGLVAIVLSIMIYNKIYKQFSEKSTIMTVFTALTFGVLGPVFLFAIRNNPMREDENTISENVSRDE